MKEIIAAIPEKVCGSGGGASSGNSAKEVRMNRYFVYKKTVGKMKLSLALLPSGPELAVVHKGRVVPVAWDEEALELYVHAPVERLAHLVEEEARAWADGIAQ